METDSLTVVRSVHSPLHMSSYFGSVINDCKAMLQNLPAVSLIFIRRYVNSVAHFFTRASYFVVDSVIRSEEFLM